MLESLSMDIDAYGRIGNVLGCKGCTSAVHLYLISLYWYFILESVHFGFERGGGWFTESSQFV